MYTHRIACMARSQGSMRLHSYASWARHLGSVRRCSIRPCRQVVRLAFAEGSRQFQLTCTLGDDCPPFVCSTAVSRWQAHSASLLRLASRACRPVIRDAIASRKQPQAPYCVWRFAPSGFFRRRQMSWKSISRSMRMTGEDGCPVTCSRDCRPCLRVPPDMHNASRPAPHAPALPIVCRCALQHDGAGSLASEECVGSMGQRLLWQGPESYRASGLFLAQSRITLSNGFGHCH
jgi:hypothetical protein